MGDRGVLKYPSKNDCPDAARLHTDGPSGYLAGFEWRQDMAKAHMQKRCPTCGYWSVWVPKPEHAADCDLDLPHFAATAPENGVAE